MIRFIGILFLLLSYNNSLLAQSYPPPPSRYTAVTDLALLLSSKEEAKLSAKLKNYFDNSSNQLVIVLVQSLEGATVEDYAQQLFQSWGIGQEESNNGLLLLIANKEHKIRIQVGYGLEAALPDAFCRRIIDDMLSPYFKNKAYYRGIDEAMDMVISKLKGENVRFEKNYGADRDKAEVKIVNLVLFYLLLVIFIITMVIATIQFKGRFSILGMIVCSMQGALFYALTLVLPSSIIAKIATLNMAAHSKTEYWYLITYLCILSIGLFWVPLGWHYLMSFVNADSRGSSGGSSNYSSSYSDSSSSYSDYSDYSDSFGGGSSGGGGASGSW